MDLRANQLLAMVEVLILKVGKFIIEKFFGLQYERKRMRDYRKLLGKAPFPLEKMKQKLKGDSSISSAILQNVIDNKDLSKEENSHITRSLLRHEMSILERGLEVIEIAASVSPLLGLLGTVIGMVEAFSVISKQGIGDPSIFSQSISKALITTVVGLIVAIPSYVAYLYFSKLVEDIVVELDNYATILMTRIYGEKDV